MVRSYERERRREGEKNEFLAYLNNYSKQSKSPLGDKGGFRDGETERQRDGEKGNR